MIRCFAFLALAALISVSACTEDTGTAIQPPPVGQPGGTVTAKSFDDLPSVPVARALALFDAVCSNTAAQHFAGAREIAATNHVTVQSPTRADTVYSATEDLHFGIDPTPGAKKCAIVFSAKEGGSAVADALLNRLGNTGARLGELVVGFKDKKTGHLVFLTGGRIGSRVNYSLVMADK